MKNPENKAKNDNNVPRTDLAISPLFEVGQMQETLKNSFSMYLKQKAEIERAFKMQTPFMLEMVKQVNESVKALQATFAEPGIVKQIVKMREEQMKFQESLRDAVRLPVFPAYMFGPPAKTSLFEKEAIKEKIEEEIFDEVIDEIKEKTVIADAILISPTSSIKLPFNAVWEDIKIMFKNRDDVDIYHKNKCIAHTNYEKLGFARNNTRDKSPNKLWELLYAIAVINDQKILKPTVFDLKRMIGVNTSDALHRVKMRLEKQLEIMFGISEPFLSYKKYGYYKTKFKVISEPNLRNTKNPWPSGKSLPSKYL